MCEGLKSNRRLAWASAWFEEVEVEVEVEADVVVVVELVEVVDVVVEVG